MTALTGPGCGTIAAAIAFTAGYLTAGSPLADCAATTNTASCDSQNAGLDQGGCPCPVLVTASRSATPAPTPAAIQAAA